MMTMMMMLLLLLLVPLCITAAIGEPTTTTTEACVELSVWENPGNDDDDDAVLPSCDGEPTNSVMLPVGAKQYQNCGKFLDAVMLSCLAWHDS